MTLCGIFKQTPRNFDLLIPILIIGHHDMYMAKPEEELPYLGI